MSVYSAITRIDNEVSSQSDIISQINTALEGKAAGGGTFETWTITLTDGTVIEKEVAVA